MVSGSWLVVGGRGASALPDGSARRLALPRGLPCHLHADRCEPPERHLAYSFRADVALRIFDAREYRPHRSQSPPQESYRTPVGLHYEEAKFLLHVTNSIV